MANIDLAKLLGDDAESLLTYESKGIPKDDLVLPGPDFVERVLIDTDRPVAVLRNLQSCPLLRPNAGISSFAPVGL